MHQDWKHYFPDNGYEAPDPKTIVEGWCVITGWWGSPCLASLVPWHGVNHVCVYRIVIES